MAKLTLTDITNLASNPTSAQNNINTNSAAIEAAIENTVSRDGSTPNEMNADFDMNSNEILNVGPPTSNTSGARLQDIKNAFGSGSVAELVVTFDNTGSVLTTGATKTYFRSMFNGIIQAWFLNCDRSGSLSIDIWKKLNAQPDVTNTICAGLYPSVASAQYGHGSNDGTGGVSMAGWTTTVNYGDTFEFNIVSATTIQKALLCLQILRT